MRKSSPPPSSDESKVDLGRRLPHILVKRLIKDVVPVLRAAIETGYEAYDIDADHNDQQILSYYIWRNNLNRSRELDKKYWNVSCSNNDLRISAKVSGREHVLRVHRVDAHTRIPRGGKLAKKAAYESQLFLSPEIRSNILSFDRGNLIIGYDLDEVNGLGRITVEMLISNTKENKPIALNLHTLYESDSSLEKRATLGISPAEESIPNPETRRKVEAPALVRKRRNE